MKQYLFLIGICLLCILYLSSCGYASSQEIKTSPPPPVNDQEGAHHSKPDSIGAISWMVHPGNAYFMAGNTANEFYLYLQVRGNDVIKDNVKRVPLNISMVLD